MKLRRAIGTSGWVCLLAFTASQSGELLFGYISGINRVLLINLHVKLALYLFVLVTERVVILLLSQQSLLQSSSPNSVISAKAK